jgi:hypothetical protein
MMPNHCFGARSRGLCGKTFGKGARRGLAQEAGEEEGKWHRVSPRWSAQENGPSWQKAEQQNEHRMNARPTCLHCNVKLDELKADDKQRTCEVEGNSRAVSRVAEGGDVMRDLAGKTAFVTGGASGIGFALGRAFAKAGMKVMLADIETAALGVAKCATLGWMCAVSLVTLRTASASSVRPR